MMKQHHQCLFIVISWCLALTLGDYWTERATLIKAESQQAIGAKIVLNDRENKINEILMSYKLKELDEAFLNPQKFLPAQHFFKAKSGIEASKIFDFLRKLPKGASLHSHDTAIVSQEFLYNLTYKADLYGCANLEENSLKLHFFNATSSKEDPNCPGEWKLLSDLRKTQGFDEFLQRKLTLIVEDPTVEYSDIDVVWRAFMDIFIVVTPLITYKPVFQEYFYECLRELHEDNVSYLEFRGTLPQVYDLEGKLYNPVEVVGLYQETLQQFLEDHPEFIGAKLIYAPSRKVPNTTMDTYKETLTKIQTAYPNFIAGFDLVGQEDLGYPLADFIPNLLSLQPQTKFFFHAGETDWNYQATDLNMIDAVLLNTTRIGHGYAVLKHPEVQRIIKEKEIALEVSPISNQVLKLVDDMRNHPGSLLIAQGFPVVICCDDPSFWGAEGLSYDWYMAFMGMSGREGDLRLLKQLAINSLVYSSIDDKDGAMAVWQKKWDQFVDMILVDNNLIV